MSRVILIVEDETTLARNIAAYLERHGYEAHTAGSAEEGLARLDELRPDLVVLDHNLPGLSGLEALGRIRQAGLGTQVVMLTGHGSTELAVEAMKAGAADFLSKPVALGELRLVVERVARQERLASTVDYYRKREAEGSGLDRLFGESAPMRALKERLRRLQQSEAGLDDAAPPAVLITGETGTGKELVARALHRESPRARQAFVALNTAAIPAELLESELFGHEAGAFTGASKRHIGRFEQAHGGSLFLDEIGDMPASLQTRLLRVLAEGEFFRVGGRELIRVDVRVIAATHQDLDALVADGRFRADLLHRLDVVRLSLPPLRERKADVPVLATRFLAEAAGKLGTPVKQLQPEALRRLQQHDWPGNVRELENLCWRLAAMAPGDSISARDLKSLFRNAAPTPGPTDWTRALALAVESALAGDDGDIHARLRERFDAVLLETALAHTHGHRQQAAHKLGLGRNTLTRKLGAARPRKKP
jgi:two-component system nitrogen regulation response regulator GlnG